MPRKRSGPRCCRLVCLPLLAPLSIRRNSFLRASVGVKNTGFRLPPSSLALFCALQPTSVCICPRSPQTHSCSPTSLPPHDSPRVPSIQLAAADHPIISIFELFPPVFLSVAISGLPAVATPRINAVSTADLLRSMRGGRGRPSSPCRGPARAGDPLQRKASFLLRSGSYYEQQ